MLADFWTRVDLVLHKARASAEEIATDIGEITADHAFHIWQRTLEQRLANRRSGVPRRPLVWGAPADQAERTVQTERVAAPERTESSERADSAVRTENTERLRRPVVRIGVAE